MLTWQNPGVCERFRANTAFNQFEQMRSRNVAFVCSRHLENYTANKSCIEFELEVT